MMTDPVIKWMEFFRSVYWDNLLELANTHPVKRSLIVHFPDLDKYDSDFAYELLESPENILIL